MTRRYLIYSLFAFALTALLPFVIHGYGNRLANTALISAIAVIGLNFVFGYAGLISLAHAAFMGMAAYIVAILTATHSWNPWLAAFLAVTTTCLSAYITGRVLLRLKGHYLALATLGLNVSLTIVVSNWIELTGGTNGISGIPPLSVAGVALDSEQNFYWSALALLAGLALLAVRIRHSHAGRALLAVRDDELAAAMTGLPVARVKVAAFTMGAGYAAVAGCLFALHIRFISPEDFNFSHSITYLAMLIVGGEGSILGAILGAVAVTLLPELLRGTGNAYLLVFGLLVLATLVLLPRGLISLANPATYRRLNRRTRNSATTTTAEGGRSS